VCTVVPCIVYKITTLENLVNSFITLCDFKTRA